MTSKFCHFGRKENNTAESEDGALYCNHAIYYSE